MEYEWLLICWSKLLITSAGWGTGDISEVMSEVPFLRSLRWDHLSDLSDGLFLLKEKSNRSNPNNNIKFSVIQFKHTRFIHSGNKKASKVFQMLQNNIHIYSNWGSQVTTLPAVDPLPFWMRTSPFTENRIIDRSLPPCGTEWVQDG